MYQKPCNLLRASTYYGGGGGGGGGDILMRSWGAEQPSIKKGYGFQIGQYNQFRGQDPLLSRATAGAQSAYDQMFPGFLSSYQQNIAPVLASGGALTPEQARDVAQQTRGIAAQQGTVRDTSALGTELLNRQSAQQQRYQTALGQAGTIQGLQNNTLNQLTGVGNAAVNQFSSLTNPILSYISSLFQGNQQASIAQAQIAAQQAQAGSSKTAGLVGGGASIISAIAPALIGL